MQVNNYITKQYGFRLLVSAWWFTSSGANIIVTFLDSSGNTLIPKNILFSTAQTTTNNSVYCTTSYATNYDSGVIEKTSTNYVTVRFSSGSSSWGIR